MMSLPKQLVGIIKRVKSKGLITVTKEILVYFRKFKDFPKRFDQRISPIRWLFRMIITYGNACFYYYEDEFGLILDFIPHDTNSWLSERVCPSEYRDFTENKIVFFSIVKNADLPHVPIFFHKENGKTEIFSSEVDLFHDVIEKPNWGLQGSKVSFYEAIIPDHAKEGFLYQPKIENHSYLKQLANTKASNTVRILTYLSNSNEIHVLSSLIRLSINSGFTDNLVNGGIAVGIHKLNGQLNEIGLDNRGNKVVKHPQGSFEFKGAQIPFWKETIELVEKAALIFKETRLIGWDIIISEKGPVILEANRKSSLYLSQSQGEVFYNSIYIQENMKF